jgi:hypothetical protein
MPERISSQIINKETGILTSRDATTVMAETEAAEIVRTAQIVEIDEMVTTGRIETTDTLAIPEISTDHPNIRLYQTSHLMLKKIKW